MLEGLRLVFLLEQVGQELVSLARERVEDLPGQLLIRAHSLACNFDPDLSFKDLLILLDQFGHERASTRRRREVMLRRKSMLEENLYNDLEKKLTAELTAKVAEEAALREDREHNHALMRKKR
jgi:hypothetical protein